RRPPATAAAGRRPVRMAVPCGPKRCPPGRTAPETHRGRRPLPADTRRRSAAAHVGRRAADTRRGTPARHRRPVGGGPWWGCLAWDGMAVAVIDLDEADCAATVEAIRGDGGTALAVAADVADEGMVGDAVARVAAELGPPTVLV